MNPGDVRTFEEGRQLALVIGIGVWAERRGDWIDVHLTGTEKFHTTVTNQRDSERYHRTLFRNLRRLLVENGRWPFGEEGAETETRT
jgi:hypothetical protein